MFVGPRVHDGLKPLRGLCVGFPGLFEDVLQIEAQPPLTVALVLPAVLADVVGACPFRGGPCEFVRLNRAGASWAVQSGQFIEGSS